VEVVVGFIVYVGFLAFLDFLGRGMGKAASGRLRPGPGGGESEAPTTCAEAEAELEDIDEWLAINWKRLKEAWENASLYQKIAAALLVTGGSIALWGGLAGVLGGFTGVALPLAVISLIVGGLLFAAGTLVRGIAAEWTETARLLEESRDRLEERRREAGRWVAELCYPAKHPVPVPDEGRRPVPA